MEQHIPNILTLSRMSSGLFSYLLTLSPLHSPEQWSYKASTWLWHPLRGIHCIYLPVFQKHESNPDIFFLTTENHSMSFHCFHSQASSGPHICPYWPFLFHLTHISQVSACGSQWSSGLACPPYTLDNLSVG